MTDIMADSGAEAHNGLTGTGQVAIRSDGGLMAAYSRSRPVSLVARQCDSRIARLCESSEQIGRASGAPRGPPPDGRGPVR